MNRRVMQSLVVLALCATLSSLAEAGRRKPPPVKHCWEVTICYQSGEKFCGELNYCDGKVELCDHNGCPVACGTGSIKSCGPLLSTICCEWTYTKNKCVSTKITGTLLCGCKILKALGCETEKNKKGKVICKETCIVNGQACCHGNGDME